MKKRMNKIPTTKLDDGLVLWKAMQRALQCHAGGRQ
jgi:hypothetical protein